MIESIYKTLLKNKEDFEQFIKDVNGRTRNYPKDRQPVSYPCVVVLWDGEDCSYYEEFDFVYPEDF